MSACVDSAMPFDSECKVQILDRHPAAGEKREGPRELRRLHQWRGTNRLLTVGRAGIGPTPAGGGAATGVFTAAVSAGCSHRPLEQCSRGRRWWRSCGGRYRKRAHCVVRYRGLQVWWAVGCLDDLRQTRGRDRKVNYTPMRIVTPGIE